MYNVVVVALKRGNVFIHSAPSIVGIAYYNLVRNRSVTLISINQNKRLKRKDSVARPGRLRQTWAFLGSPGRQKSGLVGADQACNPGRFQLLTKSLQK